MVPARRSVFWLLLASICMVPAAAPALPEDEAVSNGETCDAVFFPDFRCDRSGRYPGFVKPMSMPYLFEDPFITTGLYSYGIWHETPQDSVFAGGDIWVLAVQARLAITDRLAFIATKDGYTWFNNGKDSQLRDQDGFFDIMVGFKYALIDRPEDNFILSPSVRIDIPVGNDRVFSGNGDGVFVPTLSSAWGYENFHLIGALGGRVPFDTDEESTSIFWGLHADYAVWKHFVPFFEFTGYHYTDGGNGTLKVRTKDFGKLELTTAQNALRGLGLIDERRFEGQDIVNLGSKGVAGHDIVTMTVGARFPLTRRLGLGVGYEFPVTSRQHVIEQRVYTSATVEF